MALLTVVQVRQNVESGLHDDALQRVMDAAEQDIDQKFGALATQVDDMPGGLKSFWTTRPIGTITSVIETIGTTDTTLDTNDYIKRHTTQLDRLNTGTNARFLWGSRVKVTYVPVSDESRRIDVYLRLIKLDLEYSGLDSSKDGDFSSKTLNYSSERERILSALERKGMFV